MFPTLIRFNSQDIRDQVVRDTEASRSTLLQKDHELSDLRRRIETQVRPPMSF